MLLSQQAEAGASGVVSISALSDRGLLHLALPVRDFSDYGFNIRSFGSWIASSGLTIISYTNKCFNIRSFGSWIASQLATMHHLDIFSFQYPLFRIVDCFYRRIPSPVVRFVVSISALSDRGLLHSSDLDRGVGSRCFNIRSFGSWIASIRTERTVTRKVEFQYPLFRIVDCFRALRRQPGCWWRVSISARGQALIIGKVI